MKAVVRQLIQSQVEKTEKFLGDTKSHRATHLAQVEMLDKEIAQYEALLGELKESLQGEPPPLMPSPAGRIPSPPDPPRPAIQRDWG